MSRQNPMTRPQLLQMAGQLRQKVAGIAAKLQKAQGLMLRLRNEVGSFSLDLTRASRNITHWDTSVRETRLAVEAVSENDKKLQSSLTALEKNITPVDAAIIKLQGKAKDPSGGLGKKLGKIEANVTAQDGKLRGVQGGLRSADGLLQKYRTAVRGIAVRALSGTLPDFLKGQQKRLNNFSRAVHNQTTGCCAPPCRLDQAQ